LAKISKKASRESGTVSEKKYKCLAPKNFRLPASNFLQKSYLCKNSYKNEQ